MKPIRVEAPKIPYTDKVFPRTLQEAFPKHPEFSYTIHASEPVKTHREVLVGLWIAFLLGLFVGILL